jgi:triacylglycerol lipase
MFARRFQPRCDEFRLDNAVLLAYAAESVYDEPEMIEAEARDVLECDDFDFFDDNDTQAFVAADAEKIVVCFRGTESDRLCDWLTDADISLVEGPLEGRVHGGFYDALSDVWHVVDRAVQQLDRYGHKTLWVTGHSLGGALASLAAGRWLDRGRKVQGLYTFGQPRAGDRTFARNFNFAIKGSAFRFVNNSDLVARIPPRSLGFHHAGTFKYFTEDGRFEEHFTWWQAFLDRWTFRFDRLLGSAFDGVEDHSMTTYRQRIEAAASRPELRLVDSAPSSFPEQAEPLAEETASPALPLSMPMIEPRRRAA